MTDLVQVIEVIRGRLPGEAREVVVAGHRVDSKKLDRQAKQTCGNLA